MTSPTMASVSRHREPTLDELLDEPIVQLIMARDGVAPDMMRKQIDRVSEGFFAEAV